MKKRYEVEGLEGAVSNRRFEPYTHAIIGRRLTRPDDGRDYGHMEVLGWAQSIPPLAAILRGMRSGYMDDKIADARIVLVHSITPDVPGGVVDRLRGDELALAQAEVTQMNEKIGVPFPHMDSRSWVAYVRARIVTDKFEAEITQDKMMGKPISQERTDALAAMRFGLDEMTKIGA